MSSKSDYWGKSRLIVAVMYESNPRVPMPPPPGWPPGIWHFFLVKFPTMQALSLVKCPLPRDFLGVKCPARRAWSDKTQINFRKPERGFQHCHFYYFLYTSSLFTFIFFFCVYSDHLGFRCELSVFGTLQSSVSSQEEVQEHESVHSKFCN